MHFIVSLLIKVRYDRKAKKEMSISYNAYRCGNKETFGTIGNLFIERFNSINRFCSEGCSVEDMHIECRPFEGSVVGRRKRQAETVVVNVVVITFNATYDTSRKGVSKTEGDINQLGSVINCRVRVRLSLNT